MNSEIGFGTSRCTETTPRSATSHDQAAHLVEWQQQSLKKLKLFDKKYYKNLIGVMGEGSTNRIKQLKNKLRFMTNYD